MGSYDFTNHFYNPDINKNLQLIEYGRVPDDITPIEQSGTTIIDQNGKTVIEILGKNNAGKIVARKYQLAEINTNSLKPPKLGQLQEVDGSFMQLNRWQSQLQNRKFRNTTNDNWDNLEKAINIIFGNESQIGNYLQSLTTFLEGFSVDIEKIIQETISQYLIDNYYSKKEVDSKISLLNKRLDNVQARVNAAPAIGPYANPSRTDQYPTNLDVNDKIQDDNLKTEINQLYETGGKQ
jgi:hypothetical protein